MPITPLITFKAGRCEIDYSIKPCKVKSLAKPGYIYMFRDEFLHFCWRPRSVPVNEPELDLLMMPADGQLIEFASHQAEDADPGISAGYKSPTNGRIIILKFASSSQKHVFWLQSKPQHSSGNPSLFSQRDHKIIYVINMLLNSQVIDVAKELRNVSEPEDGKFGNNDQSSRPEYKGDKESGRKDNVENAENQDASRGNMSAMVQNFLTSLGNRHARNESEETRPFPSLIELLSPANTIQFISQTCNNSSINKILMLLPKELSQLVTNDDHSFKLEEPKPLISDVQLLNIRQKRELTIRVLRSPQFRQSLDSLTLALRGGGLVTVSEALGVSLNNDLVSKVNIAENERLSAIEVFLDGIKSSMKKYIISEQSK